MKFIDGDFASLLKQSGSLAIVFDSALGGEIPAALANLVSRLEQSEDFGKKWIEIAYPSELKAEKIFIARKSDDMRKLGAELAALVKEEIAIWGADLLFAYGFSLRAYEFSAYLSKPKGTANASFFNLSEADFEPYAALVEGTHLVRNLAHEPANILGTVEFAKRIESLRALGVDVEILDEADLEKIGMRALLAVGQGSRAPSKVAIMKWQGGADIQKEAPLLLVGKGVVFDTGGISIKPAAGMEEMTMDMCGAATVVGTIYAAAKRQTKANIFGIVGLVENMPDGNAQRPGDIVRTLKGDTVEVLNTDAEGRMVLCDIIWYGQESFKPKAVIDMATLTGAIVVALGHENAGVFGNNDDFTQKFLVAAKTEGEGAWPMPLGDAYDKLLKSNLADMGNIGGRYAGAITAAQFLKRFVKEDMPWIHLDIAGVALRRGDDPYAPHGASGWGVRSLMRLIDDHFVG